MPKDLIEEGVELQGLRPQTPSEEAEAKVIAGRAGAGSVPPINSQSNFYETSISPSFQHDTSFVGTKVGSPGYPSTSLMPLGFQGNPVSNAAITSTVKIIGGGSGTSSAGSIELQIPSIFTPTDQTVNLPGPLAFTLATEPVGTVFGVPTTAYQLTGADVSISGTTSGLTIALTTTPTLTGDYALFASVAATGSGSGHGAAPTGFSLLDSAAGLYGKVISGTDPVSVSSTAVVAGANPFISGALVLLNANGGTPTVVQATGTSGGFIPPTTATAVFSSSITAGNAILVVLEAAAGTYSAVSQAGFGTVSDNKGNTYQLLTSTTGGGGPVSAQFTQNRMAVWLAAGAAAGSTTVSVKIVGGTSPLAGVNIRVLELSGIFPATSGIPRFTDPFTTMGPINLGLAGVGGGIFGQLGLANGGTGADLSGTGGTNQVLFQQSAGAPITVGTFDYNKLPGQLLAGTYNGITLAGLGLVSITGVVNSTTNTANISATGLGTGSLSGLFRITFYMIVTRAATTSSTLPSITFNWTDPDITPNTTQAITFSPANPNGNTTTTYLLGECTVYHKPSAAGLTYATTGYASVGGTSMAYSVHIRVEQLGF